MFSDAELFNQDISKWEVSSVTSMHGMFWCATSFNQTLCGETWVNSKPVKFGSICSLCWLEIIPIWIYNFSPLRTHTSSCPILPPSPSLPHHCQNPPHHPILTSSSHCMMLQWIHHYNNEYHHILTHSLTHPLRLVIISVTLHTHTFPVSRLCLSSMLITMIDIIQHDIHRIPLDSGSIRWSYTHIVPLGYATLSLWQHTPKWSCVVSYIPQVWLISHWSIIRSAHHVWLDLCIIHTWIKPCSRVYFWWSVCPTNNTWHIHRVFEDSASIFGVVCLDDDDWLATQLYPCRFTNNPPYILWPYNYSRIAYDLLWSSRLNPAPIILGERHGFIVFQFHVFF